jgi:hypothetical protein
VRFSCKQQKSAGADFTSLEERENVLNSPRVFKDQITEKFIDEAVLAGAQSNWLNMEFVGSRE